MATADASGPFQWPLIDGMVAVNGAGNVAVESTRCCNHGSFHFPVGFRNAEPDPYLIPTQVSSAVSSGITRLRKITGGGRLGKVAEGGFWKFTLLQSEATTVLNRTS
jgi:hypothetical protein